MIARDTKVTHEEASRLYTRLMVKIQHNQLNAGRYPHVGDADGWCIGGREIKDALMAIAEEDEKREPFV